MYYLIVNPAAGRGRALRALETVRQFFEREGLALEVLVTREQGHATELVRALPEDARVLSLGGDGTLHEIATACVHTERKVGILPAGSGDDLAFALGIDRHDIQAALAIINKGVIRQIDTGSVNGQTFINSFGVGFDADVAYAVRTAPKLLKEQSAYLYAIVKTLSKLKTVRVRVEIDAQVVFQGAALLVSTQNGPRTGGSFLFAPMAKIDDGILEVLIAAEFGRLGTLCILPKVVKGSHLGHPKVLAFHGKHIKLSWEKARPGHMEGELLSSSDTFEIQVKPKSLNVFAASLP